MKIKVTKFDKVFSDFIRYRDGWTCQNKECSRVYSPSLPSRRGLHNSHFHGRRNYSVRFDADNCVALCFGCHQMMDSNPHDHGLFILERLGQKRFDALYERKNTLVKRRDVLTPHFYNELQLMLEEIQTRACKKL